MMVMDSACMIIGKCDEASVW